MGRRRLTEPGWEPAERERKKRETLNDKLARIRDLVEDGMYVWEGSANEYPWRLGQNKNKCRRVVKDILATYKNPEHCKTRIRMCIKAAIQGRGGPNATHRITNHLELLAKVFIRWVCPVMTAEEKTRAIAKQAASVAARSAMPISLTESQVVGVVRELENRESFDAMSFEKAFVWLQLTSGCRKIELLDSRVSTFTSIPGLLENGARITDVLVQNGISKQRQYDPEEDEDGKEDAAWGTNFEKYLTCGVHVDDWLRTLRDMRLQIGDVAHLTRAQIGAMFGRRLENATKDAFYWCTAEPYITPESTPKEHRIGTHFSRAVYAHMCGLQEPRVPGEVSTVAAIVSHALTHKQRDNSRFYEAVRVIDDVSKPPTAEAKALIAKQLLFREKGVLVEVGGVMVPRHKKRWRTERMKKLQVSQAEELLVRVGVSPTVANLKKMGISSDTLYRFHNKELTL